MKVKFIPAIALLSLCIAANLGALPAQEDQPKVPPPKFPIKLRAPQNATWAMTVQDRAQGGASSGGAKAKPSVRQLVVTKTAPIYQETAAVQNGPGWEKWTFFGPAGTYRLVQYAGSPKCIRMTDTYYGNGSRYEASDFNDLEWIGEKNYRGVEMLNKRPVYFFQADTKSPLTREDQGDFDYGEASNAATAGRSYRSFTYKAWLDAETLLPVKYDDGKKVCTFAFGTPPTSRLVPPPEVIAELKKWLAEDKQSAR